MLPPETKRLLKKALSLFAVVRGYNILVLVLAQLFATVYIIGADIPARKIIFDINFWAIILSGAVAIAGGYIINNFYDREKDLINRPQKTLIDNQVNPSTLWSVYFGLNLIAVLLASLVSVKAVLFFSAYIFALWLYSHKLKKRPIINNITSATLTMLPFFAIFIYYQNYSSVIFVHASFLFLILLMREAVKDLENIKGDLTQNYQTLPVVYGETASKFWFSFLATLSIAPMIALVFYIPTGYMRFYFILAFAGILISLIFLWISARRPEFVLIHNLLKLIIITGVFSLLLLDVSLLLNRFI